MLGPNPFVGISRRSIFGTARLAAMQTIKNPLNLVKHSVGFAKEVTNVVRGKSDLASHPKDRRFADTAWKNNPFHRAWLQIYLAAQKEVEGWIEDEKIHDYDKHRLKFLTSLLVDGLAPSNSFLNPAALKRFIETGGLSAVKGTKQMVSDAIAHFGMPSSVDKSPFEVGENLANTPGAVIYRNDVLELIQYQPAIEKVFKRPMLIIPPQINKFYIFDLSEDKSVVKYMLSKGLQVFIVSWKNPTPKQRHWNLTTYISALEKAIDVIADITGSMDVNAMAACSGGLTFVSLLAYFAAQKIEKVNSASLLVCLYDMESGSTEGTPMSLFADQASIETARRGSARKGIMDGSQMARIFAWLRPNDLIWNYWVNNYLMGNSPPAFDVLYWNADTTCLSAAFHSEMLEIFEHNPLVKRGGKSIKNTPIDLSQVQCETYSVAGTTDHICPWTGCYHSARNLGGQKVFILSHSGHIQSILNMPGNPKAAYYINSDPMGEDPEEWKAGAVKGKGSWWEHWAEWIAERSGDMKKAPKKLGNKDHHAKCDAPGTYVFE
ncbi:MAG: alpha/beta fold hydrolase [Desulfobacteraceae bacterium]|nr:alpha/beta fold hydrolase [Desulfobacteraceae bacterium]